MWDSRLIIEALRNGTLEIVRKPKDGYLAAKCGNDLIYFIDSCYPNMSPEEFKKCASISAAAYMILEALQDSNNNTKKMYFHTILSEMPRYSEVRCDHLDETTHFWSVDAWKSDIDHWTGEERQGKVVAYIDDLSGRVIYIDQTDAFEENVREVVEKKSRECREKHPYSVHELEAIISNVVDFESGELPEDAINNLENFGLTREQMRFFGFDLEKNDN